MSLFTTKNIFDSCGLKIWKVEELKTHGGSLRVFGCHKDNPIKVDKSINLILKKEQKFGLTNIKTYTNFKYKVDKIKYSFLKFLLKQKSKGKLVVGYGAAAKGNTLLNYSGLNQI